MNDVQGNYTKNETKNVTNNSDMNNHYVGSTVSKNNTETMNNTMGMYSVDSRNAPADSFEGSGSGNTISFRSGGTAVNGMYWQQFQQISCFNPFANRNRSRVDAGIVYFASNCAIFPSGRGAQYFWHDGAHIDHDSESTTAESAPCRGVQCPCFPGGDISG